MDVSTYLNPALEMTPAAKQRVAEAFTHWLLDGATKKHLPDLELKLVAFQDSLRRMVDGMTVRMELGRPVVSVLGDGHGTWCLLQRGSSWFEPHPGPEMTVIAAVMR